MPPLRVLIAEDDTMIGAYLGEMLTEMGYDVCAIEVNALDAVAAAVRCRPDLMIVDVRLGNGSGIAAVEEIRFKAPIPHVFISGDISRVKALRPDAVMLQKPFRQSDLARAVERALGPAGA